MFTQDAMHSVNITYPNHCSCIARLCAVIHQWVVGKVEELTSALRPPRCTNSAYLILIPRTTVMHGMHMITSPRIEYYSL
jgi:hypothetical protein